jgi:hypothetical protein
MTVLALLVAGVTIVVPMLKVHDQDVSVYSVTPSGKVQVIGLRHRWYVLDWGGESYVVLFGTTIGTGVATYGRQEDIGPGPEDIVPAPRASEETMGKCPRGGKMPSGTFKVSGPNQPGPG